MDLLGPKSGRSRSLEASGHQQYLKKPFGSHPFRIQFSMDLAPEGFLGSLLLAPGALLEIFRAPFVIFYTFLFDFGVPREARDHENH